MLLSEFGYAERRLFGRCHAVRYSTFLYWRKDRAGTVAHAFAHPMLVTKDNALVAIRMARAYGQCGARLFRRRFVRAGGFS